MTRVGAHVQPRAGGCCRAPPRRVRARTVDSIGRHSSGRRRLLLRAPAAQACAHVPLRVGGCRCAHPRR
eukprot:4859840-Pleurochrysis_carterae.AAC.1